MLTPQYILPIHSELVVDLFAGGGGASTGIDQAIGRPVDIAINHDPEAISLHRVYDRGYAMNDVEIIATIGEWIVVPVCVVAVLWMWGDL